NGQGFPAIESTDVEFGPEYVNAYELGLKSKWFDDRLLLNFDVFRSDYSDLQATAFVVHPQTNNGTLLIRNAASAISQRVEFETQWAVADELRISANVAYLDAHYVSFPNGTPNTLQTYCSYPPNYAASP